ncbi:transposase IS4 family protein [Roseivivax marinus]|uniref:Transposase IS4 family protein n=1 Tax=Roseivivax marinus TaxID=1379903 RepID=W4HDY9_9RHOB|nr:transposase IS4 family protein [Roseivivax marinus]
MDPATSDIRAVEFTPSRDGDSPVPTVLLDQVPQDKPIGTVTADGAYDTRRCHTAILERDAVPIIPIRKNGRSCKDDGPGGQGPERDPARHASLRQGVLEALDGLPYPKSQRGEDALLQRLR